MNLLKVTHQLIDSFSRSEKKYFSAYLSATAENDVHSRVYAFLEKKPTSAFNELENEFKGERFLLQPSVLFTYLINKILDFIAGPPIGPITPEYEISRLKQLKERGLHEFALKKIDAILAKADRAHLHQHWLNLWDLKLKILLEAYKITEYYHWLEQAEPLRQQKASQIIHQFQLEPLAKECIPGLRKKFLKTGKFDQDIIAKIQNTLLVIGTPAGLDPINSLRWFQLSFRVARAKLDEEAIFQSLKSIYENFQDNPTLIALNPHETIFSYYSFALLLFENRQFKKGLAILDSLATFFDKGSDLIRAQIIIKRSAGYLVYIIRSEKFQLLSGVWERFEADFSKYQKFQPESAWIHLYLFSGLAAWLAGDNITALKWLNRFDGKLKTSEGSVTIAMIKTLLAFIYFQNGDHSLACSEANSTLRFARSRQIDIGPFSHLLNYILLKDNQSHLYSNGKKKLIQLENKFRNDAINWKAPFLELEQGLFFIKNLKKE